MQVVRLSEGITAIAPYAFSGNTALTGVRFSSGLKVIGEGEDLLVLVTITVPSDLKKMSVNLKAPIIINVETRKAVQVILEDEYDVKYYIYDLLKARQAEKKAEKAGE